MRVANVVVCVVVVGDAESSLFVVVDVVGIRLEILWVSFLFEGLG